MENNKNLAKNIILNMTRTIFGVLFPLITYPYISRVLLVDNIGKFNFSASMVSYFSLIAAFGVTTYAVRELSKYRSDRNKLQEEANEIFTISLYTTILAYILLFFVLIISTKVSKYSTIILIQSIAIFFATIGVDWVNNIFEDFLFITIRSVILQVLALILMFIFVKNSNDLYVYTWITLITSAGANAINFFYCKRYLKIRWVRDCKLNKHLKPMLLLFFANITTAIFLNSDQTMLGFFTSDYYVGIYSVAVKIYSIVKSIFTAILLVIVPRISGMDSENADDLANRVFSFFLMILFPLTIGTFALSGNIIYLLGGEAFWEGVSSLRILSISIFCSGLASFVTYIYVVPRAKDKLLLYSSVISAFVNVALNLFMIPLFKHNGAAITTVVSETIVFAIIVIKLKPKMEIKMRECGHYILSGVFIFFACTLVNKLVNSMLISTVISIVISVVGYFSILLLLRNETLLYIMKSTRRKNEI